MDFRGAVARVSHTLQRRDPLVPRWIERYGGTARFWWAIRFSVAAACALVGLPLAAAPGGQLASLFVVTLPQMVLVSAAAMWAAIAVVATAQLALASGERDAATRLAHRAWLFAVVLLPLPLVGRAVRDSSLEVASGLTMAYVGAAIVGAALAALITFSASSGVQRVFLRLHRWSSRQQEVDAERGVQRTWLAWVKRLASHASTQDILRGFLVLFLVVYVAGGILLEPPRTAAIPAIIYLLVSFTVVAAMLAFLALFGDRWRFPLLMALLLAALLVAAVMPLPSHVFFVQARTGRVEVVDPRTAAQRLNIGTPVVVAASGGGIRAAGWVATVLRELQRDCGNFLPSVQFVSAVSGGSVGSLFVLDTLGTGRTASIADLDRAVARVTQPSLSDIAWAVAYPNVARRWLFGRAAPYEDRAWALEESWRRDWAWQSTTLDAWRNALARAAMPAVAFNAVTVSPVAPLLLANFRLPDGFDAHDLQRAVEQRDLELLTAARLSATYPFVTPISQGVGVDVPAGRVADGGYLDNSGLLTAALWVSEVLPVLQDEVTELLLIEIASSGRAAPDASRAHPVRSNGGIDQVLGPLETLTEAQGAGEALRNGVIRWAIEEQARDRGIRARLVTFELSGIPASWELTPRQREQMQQQTQTEEFRRALEEVGGSVCRRQIALR